MPHNSIYDPQMGTVRIADVAVPKIQHLRPSAGFVLLLCLILSICACACRLFGVMAALSVIDGLLLLWLSKRPFHALWRAVRTFFMQCAIILALYLFRFGPHGIVDGLMISWQIFLAFLPGIIVAAAIPQSAIIRVLSCFLPMRTAFVLSVSINFIPLLLVERRRIYEAQVLRGARILPKDLLRPWCWPDLVLCVMVPAIVQTLAMSGEIAVAAQARNFGINDHRTCWPGD